MSPVKKSRDAFRTISEVATELDVPQHVLRFWESKFSQVKPMKRGGNRRYYRPEDIELLGAIRHHLYTEGYTIKGVQKQLSGVGVRALIEAWHQSDFGESGSDMDPLTPVEASIQPPEAEKKSDQNVIEVVLEELKAIRKIMDDYK